MTGLVELRLYTNEDGAVGFNLSLHPNKEELYSNINTKINSNSRWRRSSRGVLNIWSSHTRRGTSLAVPQPVDEGRVSVGEHTVPYPWLRPWLESRSRSEPGGFGSLELEPEPLEEKNRSRSRLEKSQEPEPVPQPCDKIQIIRKLYFNYSSLGKIVSFYG